MNLEIVSSIKLTAKKNEASFQKEEASLNKLKLNKIFVQGDCTTNNLFLIILK